MEIMLKASLLLLCCVCGNMAAISEVYETKLGDIRGFTMTTNYYPQLGASRMILGFLGIPYGQPPIGEKRFMPTEAYGSWNDTLNAYSWAPKCIQTPRRAPSGAPQGEEDCLFLNIYTPLPADNTTMTGRDLPVIVWFHGGGYSIGNGAYYRGNRLLNFDVILVVVQYRMGPLGFMCLHHEGIPGNAGLLDQVLALQWVKDNIDDYGGNPDRVTIMGENSGASSVSLHMMSKKSEGLFQQVILQSGSALSEWSIDRQPVDAGKMIAAISGCDQTDMDEMVACLKGLEARDLHKNYMELRQYARKYLGGFGYSGGMPCVQETGEIFLDVHPEDAIKNDNFTHVPTLIGANRHDGSWAMGIIYNDFIDENEYGEDADFLSHQMLNVIMGSLAIKDTSSTVKDILEDKYLSNSTIGNLTSMSPGFIDIYGVWLSKTGAWKTALKQAQYADTYFYSFDFYGRWSLYPFFFGFKQPPFNVGISQGHEVIYLFPALNVPFDSSETNTSYNCILMWTNFAIYGNPTPPENPVPDLESWPKLDSTDQFYLSINEDLTVKHDYSKTFTVAVDDAMDDTVEQREMSFFSMKDILVHGGDGME